MVADNRLSGGPLTSVTPLETCEEAAYGRQVGLPLRSHREQLGLIQTSAGDKSSLALSGDLIAPLAQYKPDANWRST